VQDLFVQVTVVSHLKIYFASSDSWIGATTVYGRLAKFQMAQLR